MGKITSSSPIKTTIAFNQVPNYFSYSNKTIDLKPPAESEVPSGVVPSKYHGTSIPTDTNNGDNGTNNQTDTSTDTSTDSTPTGTEGRKARLERKINEAADKGQTAKQSRLEKRLAGYTIGQKKRTNQIKSGKTFFGRLASNVLDVFDKGAHTGKYDGEGKAKKYQQSRHDAKVDEASKINKELEIFRQNRGKKNNNNPNPVNIQNQNSGGSPATGAASNDAINCSYQGKMWVNGQCVDF